MLNTKPKTPEDFPWVYARDLGYLSPVFLNFPNGQIFVFLRPHFCVLNGCKLKHLSQIMQALFADSNRKITVLAFIDFRNSFQKFQDFSFFYFGWFQMGFGRERDENRGKFIDSNLVIFCYKQFEKLALCKSFSYIYFRLIKGKHKKIS